MGVCQILKQHVVNENDRFKPTDKVHFKYEGQVPTFSSSGLIMEGDGEIIQKHIFENDVFYVVDTGSRAVMIREREINLL
jgi:hypothetical protein